VRSGNRYADDKLGLPWREGLETQACDAFNDETRVLFDTAWKAAMGFAWLALGLTFIGVVLTCSLVCVNVNAIGAIFLLGCISEALTFLTFLRIYVTRTVLLPVEST
jgi:hypothetical protein